MTEVALEKLSGISEVRAIAIGSALHEIVSQPLTVKRLRGRVLNGVIRRHSDESESIQSVIRASQAPDKTLKAFAILDTHTNDVLGIASVQPDLELWQQIMPGPTRIMRKLGEKGLRLSRRVAEIPSGSATQSTTNISAWVRSNNSDSEYGELRSAYSQLLGETDQAWTITPDRNRQWFAACAIHDAGMTLVDQGRFDDLEAVGVQQVPASRLYVK
jgi:hypothetical protein